MPRLDRRRFNRLLIALPGLAAGCGRGGEERYSDADAAALQAHYRREAERSGRGPYGPQVYRGYRGLAELPWFELDAEGRPRCTLEGLRAIDVHAHLGLSLLLAPDIDLLARHPRVEHLLDCDAEEPGCRLDLDVYINTNFGEADLRRLRLELARSFTIGGGVARTHTIPNFLDEMDAAGVERAVLLPIAFGLPFGDDLEARWRRAVERSGEGERFIVGASVHPRDPERLEKLRRQAAAGAPIVKLHPAAQRFFPDDPEAMEIYAECERLGLVVFFHGGRAGIEPESQHRYTLMKGYEPALRDFPRVDFVLGHAGARDVADAALLAARHPNCWLSLHGQGVTTLHELLAKPGPERLLFGTDWPWYPPAATLAKVLLVTEGRPAVRAAILEGNARRLLRL